ncbi:MAG TPA: patatin-like phospholipase family protein [Dokdonella sp.]
MVPDDPPPESATVGLALSGGGIRSATFSLGVLQALAVRERLHSIDYVSSVSGGGYIASWLSAWIARAGIVEVEKALAKSPETCHHEPPEVVWLRRYSNYLTPRVGALSLDALAVVATYLRNVLLNMSILVLGVAALLAAPIAALPLIVALTRFPLACAFVALALMLISLSFVAINLAVRCPEPKGAAAFVFRPGGVFALVVLPALAAALVGGVWLLHPPESGTRWWQNLAIGLLSFYVVVGAAWVIAQRCASSCRRGDAASDPCDDVGASASFEDTFVYTLSAAAAALVGAGLLIALTLIFQTYWPPASRAVAAARISLAEAAAIFLFAPSGILVCAGLAAVVFIGLVGRRYAEASREWFARTGGTFLLTSFVWIVWLGLAFYVPPLVTSAAEWLANSAFATWLGSLIGSVVLTRVRGQQKSEEGAGLVTVLATVLATIVAGGLFVLIAVGLHLVLGHLLAAFGDTIAPSWGDLEAYSAPRDDWPHLSIAALTAIVASLGALLLAWRVDINRFSLHDMYKNRLIRCYLGASNPARKPRPFIGFDANDDLALTALPQRPHQIVNTALNLVQGSELAWQERKAASFVLMRTYCGFALARAQGDEPVRRSGTPPGMRPTESYAADDPYVGWNCLTLGTAMAISGAAASPNMGFHSQPALAALMTFFSVRLGRWCPNPARCSWRKSSPAFGLRYLLAELSGHTDESSEFVYLSDGGHFENTGVYELVRRRCARILVVDVGADPERAFEDLGNMMRKCRVDFGVDFELDSTPLYATRKGVRSKSGFVDGTIHYGATNRESAFDGKILVIKPSLQHPPTEPTDVYSYARRALTFPQQTTVDQWFDESQFESYRKLGYELAKVAFDEKGAGFFPV